MSSNSMQNPTYSAESYNRLLMDSPNNLSPFFEADFPSNGTSNEYWSRLSISRITKLENGWARIALDNADGEKTAFAGFRINPTIAFGISSQQYTLVIQVANFKRKSGAEPVLLVAGRNKKITQQLKTQLNEPLEIDSDGMYYYPLVSRRGECDCLLHSRFSIAVGNAVEFEVRVGLFEGQYGGPWRPFNNKTRKTGHRASHARRNQREEIYRFLELDDIDKTSSEKLSSINTAFETNTHFNQRKSNVNKRQSNKTSQIPDVLSAEEESDLKASDSPLIAPQNTPAIVFDDVVKTYKLYRSDHDRLLSVIRPKKNKPATKINAVNHLSFTINKGEAVALFGHNGAGKSTTLKMITGVAYPSSGSVIVNGRVSALLELTAGFDKKLTGRENIMLRGQIAGFSNEQIRRLEPEIIEFADLGKFIDQPLKTYSSGMRSRLGFAFAVSTNPEILIIDEVLAVGDKSFRRKCVAKMREIMSKRDVTILFVTHSSPFAKKFCTRGLVLDHGKLVFDGDIKAAVSFYNTNY